MDLSNDLISKFVKITNDDKNKNSESTVYGTVVEYNGGMYVRIDGSDLLTPVETTADFKPNERVTVMIKNHSATVTGNITSPATNEGAVTEKVTEAVEEVEGKVITEVEILIADRVSTKQLDAEVARIDELIAGKASVEDLTATNAEITNLKAKDAEIENLVADKASIEDLTATNARIDSLQANKADITYLDANFATIDELEAAHADIEILDTEVANINTLVNGNLTSDNILSLNITSQNTTMENAFVKDAMIDTVTANKIMSGTIDTNNVTIQSTDGSMLLQGTLLQMKDDNGKVRIQIGKDTGGNFTFILYDESGTGVLIDEEGIKSSDAIADGLIVDAKVADNANIAGSKLDIASVITEVNNDNSTTIKSNKIYLDEQGQSLEVAFNSLKTHVDTIQDVTIDGDLTEVIEQVQSNTTQITANKEGISTLVSENTIRKEEIQNLDGEIESVNNTLSSKYSSLEQDVSGFKTTVADTYATKQSVTDINNNLSTNYSTTSAMNSAIQQKANEITSSVSQTYATKQSVTDVNNKFSNYSTTSQMNSAINQKANEITSSVSDTYTTKSEFNNLQIGGTNLMRYSKPYLLGGQRISNKWNSGRGTASVVDDSRFDEPVYGLCMYSLPSTADNAWMNLKNEYGLFKVTEGDQITISMKYLVGDNCRGFHYIIFNDKDEHKHTFSPLTSYPKNVVGYTSHTWVSDYTGSIYLCIYNSGIIDTSLDLSASPSVLLFSSIKIEKGNKATAWSPAPQDIQGQIDATNNNLVNNYSTTSAMNSAIQQKANEITSSVSQTYATKQSVTDVNNKFSNYSTTSQMNSAIQQKANEITSSVSETYTTKSETTAVQNQITTSRNLLMGSRDYNLGKWGTERATILDEWYNGTRIYTTSAAWASMDYYVSDLIDRGVIELFTPYTFSCYVMSTGSDYTPNILFFGEGLPNFNNAVCGTASTTWQRISITLEWSSLADRSYGIRFEAPITSTSGSHLRWACFQLERGRVATGWAPAPEDAQYGINEVNNNLVNNYSTTSQMNSAIQQKANEITSSVSETYTTKSEFNNLQIGGKNLLLDSKREITNNGYYICGFRPTELFEVGEKYTVSICVTPANGVTHIQPYISGGYAPLSAPLYVNGATKQVLSRTFTFNGYASDRVPVDIYDNSAFVQFYRFPNDGTVTGNTTLHWVKMEKGAKATDWSPAPEDVQGQIDATNNNLQNNYSTTSAMNSAIQQKANEITSSVSKTYATKQSVTDVDNKFSNYSTTSAMNSAIQQKANEITSSVSETYATKQSVTDVDNKFSNYSTTSAMNSAIQQKANEITSSVSSTYTTKTEFDNLKIGARNYVLNSGLTKNSNNFSFNSGVSRDTNKKTPNGNNSIYFNISGLTGDSWRSGIQGIGNKLEVGKTYTIGANVFVPSNHGIDRGASLEIICWNSSDARTGTFAVGINTSTVDKWQSLSRTFTVPANTTKYSITVYVVRNGKLYAGDYSLVEGNKSIWTPAPEDVQGQIDATNNNLQNNYSTTSQMNSAIQQKANEITSSVSQTYISNYEAKKLADTTTTGLNKYLFERYQRDGFDYGTRPTLNDLVGARLIESQLVDNPPPYTSDLGDTYIGVLTFYLYYDHACTKTATITTDDAGTVYLNNVSIYALDSCQGANVTFNMIKGLNRIDIIYAEGSGGDGVSLGGVDGWSAFGAYANVVTNEIANRTNELTLAMTQGNMLYTDPTFRNGENYTFVYNNLNNKNVIKERITAIKGCPNTSGYCLKITTNGEAKPGLGGFTFANNCRYNAVFITKITAKIPVGYSIAWASNAYGDNGEQKWLSSTAGTGDWYDYYCKVKCGNSGDISSTNFFYLVGPQASAKNPVTWYVSYATVFDVTDSDERITNLTNNLAVNYSTTSQMNSAINQKANEITSSVSQTYATKQSVTDVSNNLANNYSTTSAMNSAIQQKANEITSSVSETYATKQSVTDVSNNLANNYSTTSAMNSAINQKANEITSSVSSTYTTKTEFQNLAIGGRNLIKQSNVANRNAASASYDKNTATWTLTAGAGTGDTWGVGLALVGNNVRIPYGKTYVLSFEIKVPRACSWTIDVNSYAVTGSGWHGNDNDNHSARATSSKSLVANQWIKCWSRISNTASANTNKVDIYDNSSFGVVMENETSSMTYQIRNIQGEIGNIPSEYTPAPEDVQANIDAVDGKFANYSTTSQMNSAIQQKANEITSSVSDTYATKQSVTDVNNKFSNYSTTTQMNSAIQQKANAITSSVSQTYATKQSVTDVSNNLANNYSTTTIMNSAIQQKANEITIKFTESGGYNLLQNGHADKGTSYWNNNGGGLNDHTNAGGGATGNFFATSLPQGIRYYDWVRLLPNTHYVYQAKVWSNVAFNGNSAMPLHFWFSYDTVNNTGDGYTILDYQQNVPHTGTWTQCYIHFVTGNDNIYIKPFIYSGETVNTFYVTEIMLSQSRVVQPWSPHPSEVYSGITQIDKDGIKIYHNNANGYTHMTTDGFFINRNGADVLSATSNGLYVQGNITSGSTIQGARITGSTFNSSNDVFQVLEDGSIETSFLAVNGAVSTDKLNVNDIENASYPKVLTEATTVYISPNGGVNSEEFYDGAYFTSLSNMLAVAPRNLNGYTLTIRMAGDLYENAALTWFHSGQVNFEMQGYTLYGYFYGYGASMCYRLYGNTNADSSAWGHIKPNVGRAMGKYYYAIQFQYCQFAVNYVAVYPSASSGSSSGGIGVHRGATGNIFTAKACGDMRYLVRAEYAGRVHVNETQGACNNSTFCATTGGIITLNSSNNQAGRSTSGKPYSVSSGGLILCDQLLGMDKITFNNTSQSGSSSSSGSTTRKVTETVKASSADTYRSTVYNSWKGDGTVRQGDYGHGDCQGCWFFGNNLYTTMNAGTVTKVVIRIQRQSGGVNALQTLTVKSHNHTSRPSGAPTYTDTIGTCSCAVGSSIDLVITDSTTINKLKKCKGLGLSIGSASSPYAVCSGACSVIITYTTNS